MVGGAIRSDGKISSVSILNGINSVDSSKAAIISAVGEAGGKAIRSLHIKGSVENAAILAGYDHAGVAINADASIGRVRVSGDWVSSNLVAGVKAGADGRFGTLDDALVSRETSTVAKIASIRIKGIVQGTVAAGDHFGFLAEHIGSFHAKGTRLPLASGPANDLNGLPVGSAGDFIVREIA